MRNKKILSIIKYAAMLLLLIPFIVVAVTKYDSFHSPWLFISLLFLMYLDSIIIVWLLFKIKETFILKKTALGLSMFLLGGWIIALVATFATKSVYIPAEHVFGGIYGAFTISAILLGIYAWISNYVFKRKNINNDIDSAETQPILDNDNTKTDTLIEADPEPKLNARERRKLKRQQKLHNVEVNDPIEEQSSETEQVLSNDEIIENISEINVSNSNIDEPSTQSDNNVASMDNSDSAKLSEVEADNNSLAEEENLESVIESVVAEQSDETQTESLAIDNNNIEISEDETSASVESPLELGEVAADAIALNDAFVSDIVIGEYSNDIDDDISDEFNRVISAFDEQTYTVDDGYKPVKINVFENDSIIPSEVEVVKNEFVASGKFVDYSIKDETRGMYEEIENENERKIALMTDLSKVIITSNVNATIVPIEYEILERTFENKLRQADDDAKEYYSVIKNKFLSYVGVKSRVSKLADTFKCNGEVVCKITVSGKTLLVNLNLDCAKYDAKYYKIVDVGEMSKFADTPMRIKIKNKLTLKRCLEIISIMFNEQKISSSSIDTVDYASQYPKVENAVIFMNSIAHLIRRD